MASLGRAILALAILSILVWSFFPIFATLLTSFMVEKDLAITGAFVIPEKVTEGNYLALFSSLFGIPPSEIDPIFGHMTGDITVIVPSIYNNLVVAFGASVVGTAISVLAGYALGRFRFPYRIVFLFVLLMTRMLPPIAVVIPYFAFFNSLGLLGTYHGLILTHLTMITPLVSWVLMGYFATLPLETERAARVDGCGRWASLRHVIYPMARPGIAAAWILAFLLSWNELLFGLVLNGGFPTQTLQTSIISVAPTLPGETAGWGLISAVNILSLLPPVLLALIFQRYITRLNIVDPISLAQ